MRSMRYFTFLVFRFKRVGNNSSLSKTVMEYYIFLPQFIVVEFEIEMSMVGQMTTVGTLRVDGFVIVVPGETIPRARLSDRSVDLHRTESFVLFLVEFHLSGWGHSCSHSRRHVLQSSVLLRIAYGFLQTRMLRRLLLADRLGRSRIFAISHHHLLIMVGDLLLWH